MEMYHLSRRYMNRRVRIHDCYGRCYEGEIVGVDSNNVYLQMSGGVRTSGKAQISGWSGAGILTLSLFTLLAIALI
ncbi:small nuclear ribonucleoprotein (snRNP)-like protein [Paenibacillus castaneae]|uniref:hypothetical protein n=1 Tax=Paenibacillus castaneae TaxID=474957 RepID=UPI000C9A5404|nr:hypothetical protein [Paenibacillus castaneae]NIK75253.1 small nuclear ribonucleoprotein (snRNP)-like protein [Paenibacillus castaneae]